MFKKRDSLALYPNYRIKIKNTDRDVEFAVKHEHFQVVLLCTSLIY